VVSLTNQPIDNVPLIRERTSNSLGSGPLQSALYGNKIMLPYRKFDVDEYSSHFTCNLWGIVGIFSKNPMNPYSKERSTIFSVKKRYPEDGELA